ncbi:regulatory protein RecX [Anaerotruncus sp. 1XD42-93]|jgi:regulatory protein|uniref:regulatory protein RecX n=1 Tax=Anaerotruncus sp. 1XD42-93 TaxID=2320853 RepID=UPI000EA0919F|nr:regulatory protein RecX [Anaerotruncus sp. 1XD42-93]MCI9159545.1 regulatory protein RecX [Anaerotruncus sp.]NCE73770.1 regulatory protein RecX [Anaerotruncus sp. X29]RKJ97908.1 regulatory protein RecX [Anaerotruncus sp. 1XD22-93]MCI9235291.1 regulatory protein RecX [Anaerotruncus sp.]NBK17242.1 regulatory protein RecX [Anaerotruncus sp. 1XD42-93]
MRITDVRTTKRGRVALYVEGEFLLSMHPDVFAVSGLSVGSEVDTESLETLSAEAELKKAKEKALNLLSYKEYTTKQLTDRLKRHTDEESAEQAVARMEELGLLDDDDYAERFARDLSERKKFGILRIRQEMRQRGLTSEQIEYATSLLRSDPEEKMREIIARKYPLAYEDEKVRRRAFSALMRMGYPAAEVRRVLTVSEYD